MFRKTYAGAMDLLRRGLLATPRRSAAVRRGTRLGFEELEDRTAPARYKWTGDSFIPHLGQGNLWWSNAGNWDVFTPGPGGVGGTWGDAVAAPGALDDVELDGTAPQHNNSLVDQSFGGTIKTLVISDDDVQLTLTRSLTVTSGLTQSDGTIYAQGHQLTLGGTSEWTGGGMSNPSLIINSDATLNKRGGGMNGGSITNNGILHLVSTAIVSVTNNGTLNLNALGGSTISLSCTNNGIINQSGGDNTINDLDNKGSLTLNGGTLTLGGSFAKQTAINARTTFNGGSLSMALNVTFKLQLGELWGSAAGSEISGDVDNSGGTIYAGGTTGTLEIGGNYTQGTNGTLVVGVNVAGGTTSKLKVTGTATLGGTLTVNWSGTPDAGSEWEVALFQGGVMMMSDFTSFTSMGDANPVYTHKADTWNPYKIKVN